MTCLLNPNKLAHNDLTVEHKLFCLNFFILCDFLCVLHAGFGLTESTCSVCSYGYKTPYRPRSCGKLIPSTEAMVCPKVPNVQSRDSMSIYTVRVN